MGNPERESAMKMKRIVLGILLIAILIPNIVNSFNVRYVFQNDSIGNVLAYKDNHVIIQKFKDRRSFSLVSLCTGNFVNWSENADINDFINESISYEDVFYFDNSIYLYSNKDKSIHAFDIISGKQKWINNDIISPSMEFKIVDNTAFTISNDTSNGIIVHSIDLNNGHIIKDIELNNSNFLNSRARLYDVCKKYFLVNIDGYLFCIDTIEQNVLWKQKLLRFNDSAKIYRDFVIATAQNYDIPCDFSTTYLFCFDLKTGEKKWEHASSDKYVINDDRIYFYIRDVRCENDKKKYIVAINISSGKILSKIQYSDDVYCIPISNGNELFILKYQHNNKYSLQLVDGKDSNVLNEFRLSEISGDTIDYVKLLGDYMVIHTYDSIKHWSVFYCYQINGNTENSNKEWVRRILDVLKYMLSRLYRIHI